MNSSSKWCCFCGQQGHFSNKCPWPRDIPPTPKPVEPKKDDVPDIENWYDLYGGY